MNHLQLIRLLRAPKPTRCAVMRDAAWGPTPNPQTRQARPVKSLGVVRFMQQIVREAPACLELSHFIQELLALVPCTILSPLLSLYCRLRVQRYAPAMISLLSPALDLFAQIFHVSLHPQRPVLLLSVQNDCLGYWAALNLEATQG